MADITDPQLIAFSNVYMRPISERLRDLQLLLTDAKTEYNTNIAGILTPFAASDVLADGRIAEGVTQVTKQDIQDLLTHVNAVLTNLDTAGQAALRSKFTVRPPLSG